MVKRTRIKKIKVEAEGGIYFRCFTSFSMENFEIINF